MAVKEGVKLENGNYHLYINGALRTASSDQGELVKYNDDYYYIFPGTPANLCHNQSYYIGNSFGFGAGNASFDADCKMIKNSISEYQSRTNIRLNYVIQKGLTRFGKDWYWLNSSSGSMYKNGVYWISGKIFCHTLSGDQYTVDADGKLTINYASGSRAIQTINGQDYFFIQLSGSYDGSRNPTTESVPVILDLYELNGNYYYPRESDGTIVKNNVFYVKTSNLGGNGWYCSDSSGAVIRTVGFVQIDDDYYYVKNTNGLLACDETINISTTLLGGNGYYQFNSDGKLITQPNVRGDYLFDDYGRRYDSEGVAGVVGDGAIKLYYITSESKIAPEGLCNCGNNVYRFIKPDRTVLAAQVDTTVVAYIETTLLSGNGYYAINDTGKLVSDGLVNANGRTYRNGQFTENTNAGVFCYENFIRKSNEIYSVSDNDYFFESNGRRRETVGLFAYDGGYSYIKSDYTVIDTEDIYVATNDLNGINLPSGVGWYSFSRHKMQPTAWVIDNDGNDYVYENYVRFVGIKPNIVFGDSNHYTLFDENGVWQKTEGLHRYNNGYCYITSHNYNLAQNENISLTSSEFGDGGLYYFGNDCMLVKPSWVTDKNGNKYYYDANGNHLNGLQTISEVAYLFDGNGKQITNGIKAYNGKYYYILDSTHNNAVATKGLYKYSNEYYYVKDDKTLANGVDYVEVVNVEINHTGESRFDSGHFAFDENCKMVKDGEIYESDELPLYNKVGLIIKDYIIQTGLQFREDAYSDNDGDTKAYYSFFNDGTYTDVNTSYGQKITSKTIHIPSDNIYSIREGNYEFDKNGFMIYSTKKYDTEVVYENNVPTRLYCGGVPMRYGSYSTNDGSYYVKKVIDDGIIQPIGILARNERIIDNILNIALYYGEDGKSIIISGFFFSPNKNGANDICLYIAGTLQTGEIKLAYVSSAGATFDNANKNEWYGELYPKIQDDRYLLFDENGYLQIDKKNVEYNGHIYSTDYNGVIIDKEPANETGGD